MKKIILWTVLGVILILGAVGVGILFYSNAQTHSQTIQGEVSKPIPDGNATASVENAQAGRDLNVSDSGGYKSIVGDTRGQHPTQAPSNNNNTVTSQGQKSGEGVSGSTSLSNLPLSPDDLKTYTVNQPMDKRAVRKITGADKALVDRLMKDGSRFNTLDYIDRDRAERDFNTAYNVIINWQDPSVAPDYRIWVDTLEKGKIIKQNASFIEYNQEKNYKGINVVQQVYVPVLNKKQTFEYQIYIDTNTSKIVYIDYFVYDNPVAREELLKQRADEAEQQAKQDEMKLRLEMRDKK